MVDDTPGRDVRFPSIDLQHLRFVVTAADFGSFRQAADMLRIRQSQLSRRVRQLEHSIGAAVFERSSGGVKPTSVGRDFLKAARAILQQVDALVSNAKADERGTKERLSVGFSTSLSTGNLRRAMLEFKVHFPGTQLVTVERSRARLASALRNGTLDILVVATATPVVDSRTLPLWSERILAALPEGHPLTARDVVLWTELKNQTILLSQYDPGHELEAVLLSKLPLAADRPHIERHDVSRGVIKSLVNMRLGISLVMDSDVGAKFSGLVYRELTDGYDPSFIGFSAHWRGDNHNPALRDFLELLANRYSLPIAGA